jgi:hypothetical protein
MSGCGAPWPFIMCDAADVGTCMRGDRINGAPRGVEEVRSAGDVSPAMPLAEGLSSRCDSAAATRARHLHSSSDTAEIRGLLESWK